MANLNTVLQIQLKNTRDALGVAVVDLHSGLLIAAAHNAPHFTDAYLDTLAASAVDMFRGKAVTNIEKMMTGMRGSLVRDIVKEAQITTEGTCHFMATSPAKPGMLAVLITTRRADLVASWSAVRGMLPAVAPYCP
jgi:hypothetical protein